MRLTPYALGCRHCGEPVHVFHAADNPDIVVCARCGRSWPLESEPHAAPVDARPNPGHYEGDGEVSCARALQSMTWTSTLPPMQLWWWACAFKYLWRWPWKNGAEDLRKAKDCIERLLAEVDE